MDSELEFPDELRWETIEAAALAASRSQQPDWPMRSLGIVTMGSTTIVALASNHPVPGTHHMVEIDLSDRDRPEVTMVSGGSACGWGVPDEGRPLIEAESAIGNPSYALVLVHDDVAMVRGPDGIEARRAGPDNIVLVAAGGPSFVVEAISEDDRCLGSLVVAEDL